MRIRTTAPPTAMPMMAVLDKTILLASIVDEAAELSGWDVEVGLPTETGRDVVVGALTETGRDEDGAAVGVGVGISEEREIVRLYNAAQSAREIPYQC
jgi:hypothetical protein